jgi:hypothetical protein
MIMDKPLYTFQPLKQSFDTWFVVTAIATLLLLGFLYFFRKKSTLDVSRKGVIIMMLAFLTLISGGTALFRFISLWRLQTVEIYQNRIVTPYGTAPMTNIRDYYVKLETHYKPMQANVVQDSARYFFLIEKNDKTHVLSEGDYRVYDILDAMNNILLK